MAKARGNSFEARDKKTKKRSSIVKMSELREENSQSRGQSEEELAPEKQIINEASVAPVVAKPSTVPLTIKTPVEQVEEPLKNTVSSEAPAVVEEINTPVVMENSVLPVLDKTPVTTETQVAPVSKIAAEKSVIDEKVVEEVSVETPIIIENPVAQIEVNTPITTKPSSEITIEEIDTLLVSKVDKSKKNKTNVDDFFNLNVKNDVFEGKITTVRVYDDMLDLLKKYASMKNYQIIEFTNKVITMGLDDINSYEMLQISEIKLKNNTSRSIMYNLTDTMEEKLNKYIKMMNKRGYKISRNVILNVILNETLKKFHV